MNQIQPAIPQRERPYPVQICEVGSPGNRLLKKAQLGLITALLACVATNSADAQSFTLTELAPLAGYTSSFAYSINNAGQVVGYSQGFEGSPYSATLWSGGSIINLGTLGGTTQSLAEGINNAGQVVGYSWNNGPANATLWSGGSIINLNAPGSFGVATGINNAGQVVGFGWTTDALAYNATLWSGGSAINLGPGVPTGIDNAHAALGINDAGQVVGYRNTSGGYSLPILWSGGSIINLGTLGGANGAATGINGSGQVVGYSQPASNFGYNATLWSGGKIIDLGTVGGPSGAAFGINDSGQVVGYSETTSRTANATLWSGGSIINLNTLIPGSEWSEARGINNRGQIVGVAYINQLEEAFLLTPNAVPGPIPGAGTLSYLLLGFAGLLAYIKMTWWNTLVSSISGRVA